MSPIHMSGELISAVPVLGDQDFNSFNLDEDLLQNPDQELDIEEMFRCIDEHKLTVIPEVEPDVPEEHNVEVCDSGVADYMWNCMDVKSNTIRPVVKTNVAVNSRPRSLLRCNLNVAPPPPPVSVSIPSSAFSAAQCGYSDGGSDFSEDSGRPETPNSISDCDETFKVDDSSMLDMGDYSLNATCPMWSRNFVPESAFIHSNDDEYVNVQAVPLSEVTGHVVWQVWNSPASSTSNWTKSASETAPTSPPSQTPATTPTPVAHRDPAAIAAATSNLINDHSYPLNRNGFPGIPGNLTPSDSEEDEIDVVSVVKTRPSRSSAALPNNPTASDRRVLQRTVASKISPPQTPAASPAPSPPPSPPRRTPAIMGGPSLNQMSGKKPESLVRSKLKCSEAISTRRRREVRAAAEDEDHVRKLRQRETGFVPQPAPPPIRKEVRALSSGLVMPSVLEHVRPDWLVVCHNKRDRFRKSRARIEQDAWQNVQSVRKKHRQNQAMRGRRVPMIAPMSDFDSDEESSSSRRGRGSNNRGSKRKHKRDQDNATAEERRSQHNHMERRRRVDLRESFDELRIQIPMTDGKAAKVAILEGAATRIRCLQNVEEQLLDEEDRLLKEYFNLRVRLLRLSVPPRELEGWSDHDLILHEVVSAVEEMEMAEGICNDDDRESQDCVDEEVAVVEDEDEDDDDDDEEEEEEVRMPAAKRRRTTPAKSTRHRDSDSDSGDDDDSYYRPYR